MDITPLDVDAGIALDTYADPAWCVGVADSPETVSEARLFAFGTFVDGRLIDPRGAPAVGNIRRGGA